jgi:hypothetical protein
MERQGSAGEENDVEREEGNQGVQESLQRGQRCLIVRYGRVAWR